MNLHRALRSLLTALVLAHAATAVDAADRRPVQSLLEIRTERVVVQEFDLSCGAAALATLLTYQFGDPVTEREVTRGLIAREEYLAMPELVRVRQGFSLLDLKRFVDARGYQGLGYGKLEFHDLVELAPILIPVDFDGYDHFVVFRGVAGDRAVIADPAYGNRTMPVGKLIDNWHDSPTFGRVGFVVARPDGSLPPNRLMPPSRQNVLAPSGAVVRSAIFR